MKFSFIDAKREPNSRSRAFARFSRSARAVILLGKTALQANADARTWCFLPISVNAFACRKRPMGARACMPTSSRMASSPDATGLPG